MTAALAALVAGCASPAAPSPAAVFGATLPDRLAARMVTDEGTVHCTLEPSRAPRTAALVAALARGGFAWRDPRAGAVTTRPLYRDVPFHRVIPGVLVQGGCPRGDGTGHPGYRIPLETRADDAVRLAQPGVWFTATYTPPPLRRDPAPPPPGHVVGSQFVVGIVSMAHLAGRVTVLGRCDDLDVLRRIAARPPERPARLARLTVGDAP